MPAEDIVEITCVGCGNVFSYDLSRADEDDLVVYLGDADRSKVVTYAIPHRGGGGCGAINYVEVEETEE